MPYPQYTPEEVAQRGEVIYEQQIRARVEPEHRGQFVVIDEIDNLPENYQNIFLQISGQEAKLAPVITSYADSGQVDYTRGQHTFIAFAANYPELAAGKRSISAPLSR